MLSRNVCKLHRQLGRLALMVLIIFLWVNILFAEPRPWIAGRKISDHIAYQYRIEQRPGFHQQIHHVRVNLKAPNVDVFLETSEGFPRGLEYPSDMAKRTGAQVVIPASLFTKDENKIRYSMTGEFLHSGKIYSTGEGHPGVQIRPLNRLVFLPASEKTERPRIVTEDGKIIFLSGLNRLPGKKPGVFLYTSEFFPLEREDITQVNNGRFLYLYPVPQRESEYLYYVRKEFKKPEPFHPDPRGLLLWDARPGEESLLSGVKEGNRLEVLVKEHYAESFTSGVFCGGPYFIKNGEYDEDAVREFCKLPGAPEYSHYDTPLARLAISLDQTGTVLDIYAVDRRGVSREGMTLADFAAWLTEEGVEEAMCLPDGEMGSLTLPGGMINATGAGMEKEVISAICIREKDQQEKGPSNLLRGRPVSLTSNGSKPGNPASAVNDGSYYRTPTLDNYWESDTEEDAKPTLRIDLREPCLVSEMELFYAEEAGFSDHFNWRSFTIFGHETNVTRLEKIMEVENPKGHSCQRISFPENTKLRYLAIQVDQPSVFPENKTARLAEIILQGLCKRN